MLKFRSSEIPGKRSCLLSAGSVAIWIREKRQYSGPFCFHLIKGFWCPLGPPDRSIGSDSVRVLSFSQFDGHKRQNRAKCLQQLYSQAVTHQSTNRSQPWLTSVIGRELMYSRWYGRRHLSRGVILMQKSKSAGQTDPPDVSWLLDSAQEEAMGWVKMFLWDLYTSRLLWFLLQQCSIFVMKIASRLKTHS